MSELQITTVPANRNGKAGADFKRATDDLLESVTYDALAKELGVSVSLVRQARVRDDALCHRNPPKGWEPAVLRLAKQKAEHFRRLAERLSAEDPNADSVVLPQ